MKISEFFEKEYVPTYLADVVEPTVRCYRTSIKKLKELCGDPSIYEVNLHGTEFVRKLREEGLNNATIAKHCRHLNSIFLKLGPRGKRNRRAKALLDYAPYFQAPKVRKKRPRVFSDNSFQALFNAFENETEYPKHLPKEKRPIFWQTVMVFVSITAVRREAVLGLKWKDIDREDLSVHIRSEIDKKDQDRDKPIKPILIEYLEQIRFGNTWESNAKIFQWGHGDKQWYKCWHQAEERAGIKMGLHDIKRYSGDLAIRNGATELELMEHMDHEDIRTTRNHYCRAKTRELVDKIVVPIPGTETVTPPPTPPPSSPLEAEVMPPEQNDAKAFKLSFAPAFKFYTMDELQQYYQHEADRLQKSEIVVKTPNGTILTLYEDTENQDQTSNALL